MTSDLIREFQLEGHDKQQCFWNSVRILNAFVLWSLPSFLTQMKIHEKNGASKNYSLVELRLVGWTEEYLLEEMELEGSIFRRVCRT